MGGERVVEEERGARASQRGGARGRPPPLHLLARACPSPLSEWPRHTPTLLGDAHPKQCGCAAARCRRQSGGLRPAKETHRLGLRAAPALPFSAHPPLLRPPLSLPLPLSHLGIQFRVRADQVLLGGLLGRSVNVAPKVARLFGAEGGKHRERGGAPAERASDKKRGPEKRGTRPTPEGSEVCGRMEGWPGKEGARGGGARAVCVARGVGARAGARGE